ncbi:3795_t:CDS:2 [Entrophospora sp. SA101]|nr:5499_t:CDS:2 [Entrophospora sp. SA101]CAJ0750754.1 3790_t:CDS:2 [Entrophospora sp. SA101]CAJ0750759.1 3795_t:CDS:2 [Entrophospora sp. SA101]CAJ0884672.1 587_t:CDS:2 [Entrophospora sp. SA101]CAJ0884728.1 592_t:CDS:2 [Entrophospora sp. SA101]
MKITKLRAKPKKLEQLGPCTPEVAALLTCWANNTMNSSACIQNVQALSNCMRNVPRKTKPPNTINYHLSRLDFPKWLYGIRMHRYVKNFENMKWEEIVELDSEGLEQLGIEEHFDRKKLLKEFRNIRNTIYVLSLYDNRNGEEPL